MAAITLHLENGQIRVDDNDMEQLQQLINPTEEVENVVLRDPATGQLQPMAKAFANQRCPWPKEWSDNMKICYIRHGKKNMEVVLYVTSEGSYLACLAKDGGYILPLFPEDRDVVYTESWEAFKAVLEYYASFPEKPCEAIEDGMTPKTAISVQNVHQEYEYLNGEEKYHGQRVVKQSFLKEGIDCLELMDREGNICKVYFKPSCLS